MIRLSEIPISLLHTIMLKKNIEKKHTFSFFLMSILLVCVALISSHDTLSKTDFLKEVVTFNLEIPNNNNENTSEKEVCVDVDDEFFANEESAICIHSNKIYAQKNNISPVIPVLAFDIQIPPPKKVRA
ncbi:MAG: hypothetical protein JNJ40_03375 [Bacteroidia bacterium]|nr:hypothetical protein [Bacteroidia bacterium]